MEPEIEPEPEAVEEPVVGHAPTLIEEPGLFRRL